MLVMTITDKSLSEALIFAINNPQYDDRLFIVHENCKLRIPAEPAAKYYKHKHKDKPNMLVSIALAKFNFLAYIMLFHLLHSYFMIVFLSQELC